MDKKHSLFLLESAINEGNPALVHGTSTVTAMHLLSKGRLPSYSLEQYKRRIKTRKELEYLIHQRNHPAYNGYLFFNPRKKSFTNNPLYDKIKLDLDGSGLIDEVEPYASGQEQTQFMKQRFGYWPFTLEPWELGRLFDNSEYSDFERQVLREAGLDLSKIQRLGIKEILEELDRRKGVVIGVNERIFEKNIEDGHDDPGQEVMIYLPHGLSLRYVQFIHPLGPLEKRILRSFISKI